MKTAKFRYMSMPDKIFTIFNYTILTLVLIVIAYPLIFVVSASFSDPQAVVRGDVLLLPVNPTLRGYQAVFKNGKILTGFMNSVFYLVAGTCLNLVMTMLCAYPLSRKEFKARGFISLFFVFTNRLIYFVSTLIEIPLYILRNSICDNLIALHFRHA